MSKTLTSLLCAWCCVGLLHAQSLWTEVSGRGPAISGPRYIIPQTYRTLQLDVAGMENLLETMQEQTQENGGLVVTLPMPDGSDKRFRINETPVMAPALQAKYPEIRCYTGRGVDDPTASLKCDLTPWGFHAMIISRQQGTIFIDPYAQGNRDFYISYFKKELLSKSKRAQFSCGAEPHASDDTAVLTGDDTPVAEFQGDCQLRRYRLALACTREYAAFHGDTKPLVMAAMNTSMNRVNGVYENDLAVTMELVANNDTLIFLSTGTDPYSNNNGGAMLNQNVNTCNSRIGSANFDIGHVFSTGGGGIAGLGVVCTSIKAEGVTGSDTPIGDGFDVDYVAHEMGHQFGANHTQNNDCNNESGSSMEPGSASTIMGYAGICDPNVQNHSDDYFHAISLQEIGLYITNGDGNTCPVKTVTGNSKPTVNGGANYTIPKSTPFALTAIGNDVDQNDLTYCWEQMDAQFATMPPNANSTGGPLFRSFDPVSDPVRYFPALPEILLNNNPTWERLPGVARSLNFRVTARDNNPAGGCTGEDNVLITVAGTAGPFLVTEPNSNVLWYVGENKTVTWNVANTTAGPVNCSQVRILLSTDGGYNYPVVLADGVPNNGSASITVPNNTSNTCRIKVEGVGNIFFDLSNQNFRIQQPPYPSFSLVNSLDALTVCAGDTATFTVQTIAIAGFETAVDLFASGNPIGSTVTINPDPVGATGTATVQITHITALMSGNYSLIIGGTADTIDRSDTLTLTILSGIPSVGDPISPADGATGLGTTQVLVWEEVNFAASYTVQVSDRPDFESSFFTQVVTSNSVTVPNLQPGWVYYWRVRASNDCGNAAYSETFAFQTQNLTCNQTFASTDVPAIIDEASVNTALSVLEVPAVAVIGAAQVSIQASHSYVGDLHAVLSTPWGQDIWLFDRPGVPTTQYGCSGNNLNLIFNDAALLDAAALENQCNTSTPALSGTFQPIQPLSVLNGQGATGEWRLSVTDNVEDDGGTITGWSLRFCFLEQIPDGAFIHNNTLTVPEGGAASITTAHLEAVASGDRAQVLYTLLQTPAHGSLKVDGVELSVGDVFSQAIIDANLLIYNHNGDDNLTDNFYFDVYDQNNLSWLHDNVFSILILQNNLSATGSVVQPVSCNNGSDASVNVAASGLDGVYTYSLNGLAQTSNVFSGLSAGTYTITITGQLGLTTTAQVTVANPTAISINTTVTDDDIAVTATGGTGVYTYSLDGQGFQPGNVFQNVPNGIYSLTVRDGNNCTVTTLVIVAVNSLLAFAEATHAVSCFGGNDGTITVTAGGSQPPFEYSLNGTDFQSSNVFNGLQAGAYTVTVRDAGSLVTTTNSVVLNTPSQLAVTATVDVNDITVVPAGGTPPYTLTINGIASDSFHFTDLTAGIYTFVVTDANGCSVSTEAEAFGNTLAILFQASAPVSCSGDSDGLIALCIDGGIPPLTATIYPAAGNYTGNIGGCGFLISFTDLPAGTYSVLITDAEGFTLDTSATVISPDPLLVSAANAGDTIIVSAAGGTFSYEYSVDGFFWQVDPEFPDLPNGIYTVYARDIKGCVDSTELLLDVIETIDPASAWGVQVSPNPGTGLFQLTMSEAPSVLHGDISDMTGKILRRLEFDPGSGNFRTQIDLQDLPQGVYVLRLTDGVRTGALRLRIVR